MEEQAILREAFKDVMKKYNLKLKEIESRTIFIYNSKLILEISMYHGQLGMSYIQRTIDGRLIRYCNIDSFIAINVDKEDRERIAGLPISYADKAFRMAALTIDKKFPDMLRGEMDWLLEYSGFRLSSKPRDVTDEYKRIVDNLDNSIFGILQKEPKSLQYKITFSMQVVAVFIVKGQGIFAAGYVEEGKTEIGAEVIIKRNNIIIQKSEIIKIVHKRVLTDKAKAKQNVALLLKGVEAGTVAEGDTIICVK